jgi:hypothetical protein
VDTPRTHQVQPSARSAVARATPENAFAAWTNVDGWTAGEQIQSVSIDGEFRAGAIIPSNAKGFPASTLTVTRVEAPTLWVDESRALGLRMTFEHVIERVHDGVSFTERVTITGPLARVAGPLMRRKMEALFAASTSQVAAQAEAAGKS